VAANPTPQIVRPPAIPGPWDGRFAPSPTGALHLGNFRTALVAWLVSRHGGGRFVLRVEDLDAVVSKPEHGAQQLEDLVALGIDWDGPVLVQSTRHDVYEAAVDHLRADGLVYECFCTRKEIAAASQAPNSSVLPGRYPGTCRGLTTAQRVRLGDAGRPPALRLRVAADVEVGTVDDLLAGTHEFAIDDLVLRRNDGTWAYNLAVVVDDAAQGIGVVVRGDDLLSSSPRQAYLASLLGLPAVEYLHVPLAVNRTGDRLAKRDGAVTLAQRLEAGDTTGDVVRMLAASLGLNPEVETARDLIGSFDFRQLPRSPWTVDLL
jgi:glutamyl-tRNA synthetase